MSELKSFESERIYWAVEQVEQEAGDIDTLHLDYNSFYLKEEVDAVISNLKEKLEDAKATAYTGSVDAGMRDRRLKRALWLARAERASDKARIFYFAETCGVELNIDGFSNKEKGHTRMRPARWWRLTWLKVERKCRAKAEEYK